MLKLWRKHRADPWEVEEVVLDDDRAKCFVALVPLDLPRGVRRCRTAWEE